MKKLLCILLALTLLVFGAVSCDNSDNDDRDKDKDKDKKTTLATTVATTPIDQSNIPYAVTDDETNLVMIDVAGYGKIVVELSPETAPITVSNFKHLVSNKFYDGLIFHRIIEGFMIQGGGFNEGFIEKSSESIKGEFASNGIQNDLKHTRGVISMARTSVPDSASSQFFIMHQDAPHLDGDYAAFGMTVYGIEVVDAIASVATDYYDMPISSIIINSIRFAEKIG